MYLPVKRSIPYSKNLKNRLCAQKNCPKEWLSSYLILNQFYLNSFWKFDYPFRPFYCHRNYKISVLKFLKHLGLLILWTDMGLSLFVMVEFKNSATVILFFTSFWPFNLPPCAQTSHIFISGCPNNWAWEVFAFPNLILGLEV